MWREGGIEGGTSGQGYVLRSTVGTGHPGRRAERPPLGLRTTATICARAAAKRAMVLLRRSLSVPARTAPVIGSHADNAWHPHPGDSTISIMHTERSYAHHCYH